MRHIAWSPENEVFIAQFDAEHRDLYEIAGELERCIEAQAPDAERGKHLDTLATHIEEHFQHEEWLMQSVHYPSYGWHRQQHDSARRRLRLFVPLVEAGDEEAAEAFFEFLGGWLNDHTGVADRMMAAFVRNYERAHATGAVERWLRARTPVPVAHATNAAEESGPHPQRPVSAELHHD